MLTYGAVSCWSLQAWTTGRMWNGETPKACTEVQRVQSIIIITSVHYSSELSPITRGHKYKLFQKCHSSIRSFFCKCLEQCTSWSFTFVIMINHLKRISTFIGFLKLVF